MFRQLVRKLLNIGYVITNRYQIISSIQENTDTKNKLSNFTLKSYEYILPIEHTQNKHTYKHTHKHFNNISSYIQVTDPFKEIEYYIPIFAFPYTSSTIQEIYWIIKISISNKKKIFKQ